MSKLIKSGRIIKSVTMAALVATFLGALGFYDGIHQAKSQNRLETSLVKLTELSERRIKRNIEKLTTLENGLNLYKYQYKSEPTIYVGLLADDLVKNKTHQHAVVHMWDGYYAINYEKLGIQQVTYETYQKEGLNAVRTDTIIAGKNKSE